MNMHLFILDRMPVMDGMDQSSLTQGHKKLFLPIALNQQSHTSTKSKPFQSLGATLKNALAPSELKSDTNIRAAEADEKVHWSNIM